MEVLYRCSEWKCVMFVWQLLFIGRPSALGAEQDPDYARSGINLRSYTVAQHEPKRRRVSMSAYNSSAAVSWLSDRLTDAYWDSDTVWCWHHWARLFFLSRNRLPCVSGSRIKQCWLLLLHCKLVQTVPKVSMQNLWLHPNFVDLKLCVICHVLWGD